MSNAKDKLAPFARLIGGQWHAEGTYQVFEWGVGQLSVKSSAYFAGEAGTKLTSEGLWFWHPGEKQIKGYFSAIDMPVAFFDYTTRFEADRMVSDLKSYTPEGEAQTYVETWAFAGDDQYEWTLAQTAADGEKVVMRATFTRRHGGV